MARLLWFHDCLQALTHEIGQENRRPALLLRRQAFPYSSVDVWMKQRHHLGWNRIGHANLLSNRTHWGQSYVPSMPEGMPPERNATVPVMLQERRWAGRTLAWSDNELNQTSKLVYRTAGQWDASDQHSGTPTRHADESAEGLRAFGPPADANGTSTWLARCVWWYYVARLYNHLRRHRSLGRRTPASVYGLEALPQQDNTVIALPPRGGIIETGDGRSVAACAAVAPAALRLASATAADTLPMATVPPYSRPETVQRMGTS